jgi:hypothetical protein
MRRHANVLFPPGRRAVTQQDIDNARQLDRLELEDLKNKMVPLLRTVSALPATVDFTEAASVMEQLEQLWESCVAEGTEALNFIVRIDEMIRDIREAAIAALSDTPEILARFIASQELRKSIRRRFANPIVLDLQNVPPEDLIYAVVTESPESIAAFVEALSSRPEALHVLREYGLRALHDAVNSGYPSSDAAAKAQALISGT